MDINVDGMIQQVIEGEDPDKVIEVSTTIDINDLDISDRKVFLFIKKHLGGTQANVYSPAMDRSTWKSATKRYKMSSGNRAGSAGSVGGESAIVFDSGAVEYVSRQNVSYVLLKV